ncbi:hypothetical protein Deipr_1516 [Deinococcus proteolyticus MRP]|uniref:Uncharacterized protein n=1 Tax=Deinococcus proteolyticus (strain ATCC 35074 / DSM 20540 / JCM 6276 / NBRC 101906 / NCIMB 13154 / VKM Ac-1939 / CCM 2703 / MRP) TaxID=693977 RepID=F0RK08_DEIPM|nr:hypothetical protein [Deinococcus proteolyticus]ADY26654.1 hypothetical protein Deipr_1516 [Deinococcus proteolyticus MRP]
MPSTRSLLAALALAALAPAQAQATPPAIQAIRDNYAAVNAQIAAGQYRKSVVEGRACGDFYETRTRWKDGRGVLRRYQTVTDGTTYAGDTRFTTEFWFDAAGRRDFVLMKRRSTPSERAGDYELRVYYNDAGAVIRTLSQPQLPQEEIRTLLTAIDGDWNARSSPISGCGD